MFSAPSYRYWGSVHAVRPIGEVEEQLYSFLTAALEGGEGSASRSGRSLPPGKTRYPLYRRLGGPVWTTYVYLGIHINVNTSLTNKIFPSLWKQSDVAPVFYGNYRHIFYLIKKNLLFTDIYILFLQTQVYFFQKIYCDILDENKRLKYRNM